MGDDFPEFDAKKFNKGNLESDLEKDDEERSEASDEESEMSESESDSADPNVHLSDLEKSSDDDDRLGKRIPGRKRLVKGCPARSVPANGSKNE